MNKEKFKHPVFLLLISMLVGFIGVVFFKDNSFGTALEFCSGILWLAAFIQYWRS